MKLTIVILLLIFLILFSGLLTYLIITRTNRFFELLEAKNNAQNNNAKGIEDQNNSQVQNQDESATAVVPSSTTNG